MKETKSQIDYLEQATVHAEPVEFEEHGTQRKLEGWALKALMAAALSFSTYQLFIAAFSPLSSQVTRSLHVGFLLLLTYLLYPAWKKGDLKHIPWYDWLIALSGFALGFYHWIFEAELVQRAGVPTTADLIVGTVVVLLVFEAVRRVMGLALRFICGAFLLFGWFCGFLSSMIGHR